MKDFIEENQQQTEYYYKNTEILSSMNVKLVEYLLGEVINHYEILEAVNLNTFHKRQMKSFKIELEKKLK